MTNLYIIEYIGAGKLVHSKEYEAQDRLRTPHAGDVIDFGDFKDKYPFSSTKEGIGRIEGVGVGMADKDEAHVCCELGSAFLHEGSVSISGGPFCCIKLADLEPTFSTRAATFWNWGHNGSGAGHGVRYIIARPVFKPIRYARKD